ncbi:hypothetical protein D3C81_545200 [compost metagenome]
MITIEEGWRELLLKMQVSEVVKKYILSIDEEAKEYFEKTLGLIQNRIKQEVLSAPLVSGYNTMRSIIEKEMSEFVQTVVSLIDYYSEGIYFSGKIVSRKKLRLGKPKVENGEKYSFTNNDRQFIDSYKSNQLEKFKIQFNEALVNYLVEKITNQKFDYTKQELSEDESNEVIKIVINLFSNVFDEFMDATAREIIQLFRRAQIEEYRNLGIDSVTFLAEDEVLCCPVCNARAGKVVKLNDSIDRFGIISGNNHSFCKVSIDPVISYRNQITTIKSSSEVSTHSEYSPFKFNSIFLNSEIVKNVDFKIGSFEFEQVPIEMEYRVNKLIKKFQVYSRKFLTNKKFIFVDNIADVDEWFQSVKNHYLTKGKSDFEANNEAYIAQDKLGFNLASFDCGDICYLSPTSFDSQPVENMIVRKIVADQIKVDSWVIEKYNERVDSKHFGYGMTIFQKPFVSYLAQDSAESYLIESVVAYVNQSSKLKSLDAEMFDYIKNNIFDSIEFF